MFFMFFNQIAGKINEIIRDVGLRDLGQLEQDLVFGDAGSKEVITYLRANQVISYSVHTWSAIKLLQWIQVGHDNCPTLQDSSSENKLRLLMIYAVVYPDKFEGDKAIKLMQVLTSFSHSPCVCVCVCLSCDCQVVHHNTFCECIWHMKTHSCQYFLMIPG